MVGFTNGKIDHRQLSKAVVFTKTIRKPDPLPQFFRPAALLRSTKPLSLSRHGFAAAWRQGRGGAGPPVVNNGHGGFLIAVFHHHRVGVMPPETQISTEWLYFMLYLQA